MRQCRICGCTDRDACTHPALEGVPCWWHEPDLCSLCAAILIGLQHMPAPTSAEEPLVQLSTEHQADLFIRRARAVGA